MKVLIVSPCTLPVPAVRGGAVQQLIDTIIRENEHFAEMNLTVVGLYDSEAILATQNIHHTNFIFFHEPAVCRFIDGLYEAVYKYILNRPHRVLRLPTRKIYVINRLKKLLLTSDYDRIVLENMGYQLNILDNKRIAQKYKGRCWYHLHNELPNNIAKNNLQHSHVMLISSYLEKKITQICKENTPKTVVVKNGISIKRFTESIDLNEKSLIRKRFGIADDQKVIIYVGRIIPEKGIEEVLDAFLSVKDKEDIVLLIVGSLNFGMKRTSPFVTRIHEKSLMADGKVIFTGYVHQDEIHKCYQIADVAVLPSMWEEPAGLTMLEAAASGVPVITTVAGGIPEYLNNELAIFLNRDDRIVENIVKSILEIINNPAKWHKVTEHAKLHVQNNFSDEAFYKKFTTALLKGE